ncbi:hypothetical protein [Allokutzneria albata]|uniref:PH domain-containing protein n=1 Tax=Allokutzneria albata TaxID=211114 RepID=A0A1H0C7N3_ALLAB|nr:hypothetical protein [Allokutzneria albata]SDN53843.1 hypothetical protein SAMN04489726_7069 [Allokutzneria albata]
MSQPKMSRRHLALAVGVPFAVLALLVLAQFALADALPETAPSALATAAFKLAVATSCGVLAVFLTRGTSTSSRYASSYSAIGAGYVAAEHGLYLAVGVDPSLGPIPTWVPIAVGAGVAIVLCAPVVLLAREVDFDDPDKSPRIDLAPDERATWSKTTSISWPAAAFLVLSAAFFAYLVLSARAWSLLPVLLMPCALFAFLASVRVTVDANGLTVWPTLLGWPRKRIPLDQIESATVRRAGDTFAMRLRSCETLVVQQKNGTEYVVSIDDAHTASALLNTLAHRARGRA